VKNIKKYFKNNYFLARKGKKAASDFVGFPPFC